MAKDAVFTMKLDADLRAEFLTAAAQEDRPASQVVRELMRRYIEERREAADYEAFVRKKVEAGRADIRAGRWRSNEEVEARFAALRRQIDPDGE